jgi:hypothetical protein
VTGGDGLAVMARMGGLFQVSLRDQQRPRRLRRQGEDRLASGPESSCNTLVDGRGGEPQQSPEVTVRRRRRAGLGPLFKLGATGRGLGARAHTTQAMGIVTTAQVVSFAWFEDMCSPTPSQACITMSAAKSESF